MTSDNAAGPDKANGVELESKADFATISTHEAAGDNLDRNNNPTKDRPKRAVDEAAKILALSSTRIEVTPKIGRAHV